jgi:hypothetical protein
MIISIMRYPAQKDTTEEMLTERMFQTVVFVLQDIFVAPLVQ